ncbi:MAG: ABC transporter permease [Lachnospiraceae bacterium]|jgi:ABC-2 type transport system permease protein|nr:ABC transporter permease [Lachnospiraceae bacterium]
MKVFKASLLILKRRAVQVIVYLSMFTAMFIIIASFYSEQVSTDFSAVRPAFTVINRDKDTPLTEGLMEFLRDKGTEHVLPDEKQELQDAAFYHATEYILIIPEGFDESVWSGNPLSLEAASIPGTGKSYYIDSLANQYWSFVDAYHKADSSLDRKAVSRMTLEALSLESSAETLRQTNSQPISDLYESYNRVQSYILMVVTLLCVTSITMSFRRPDLRMRNLCAPTTTRQKNLGLFLYCSLVGFVVWLSTSLLGYLVSLPSLAGADGRLVALLFANSFLYTFVALSIAMLLNYFISNPNTQNAIANFLSLALSFLGGAFVPLEFLSEGLRTVSRFTPVYWYSEAVSDICNLTLLNKETLAPIWRSFAMELGFAAAILCVALAVGKTKNKAESSFGSTRTELEM